ncbi:MAG: hypothetical protein GEU78_17405 [Actinobacteria bacterium]|nr:hypothetical protein [Actinomycetota bacterium]
MALLLDDLLSERSLGLRLIAGADGLRTRGPVCWVHCSELPDPTPWLEGGEILLTTGLGVKDSEELQRRLIRGLAQHGCTGVGFGADVILGNANAPQAMVEEADCVGLPLFTVPYEVPFIAVMKMVSHHISKEHYRTLQSALDTHRKVMSLVTSGQSLQAVLDLAARQLPHFGFIVLDYYGQILAGKDPLGRIGPIHHNCLWEAVAGGHPHASNCAAHREGRVISGRLVRVERQIEAVFAMVGHRPPEEHERLLMEQSIAGVTLMMGRELSVREMRRRQVDQLLKLAVTGRANQQMLAEQAASVGLNPAAAFRVLCVAVARNSSLGIRNCCTVVEDAMKGLNRVVGRWDGDVYLLLQPADAVVAESVVDELARCGLAAVVGRSREHMGMESLASAIREAYAAMSRTGDGGSGVRNVEDLDVTSLLTGLEDRGIGDSIVEGVLGPVLAYDRNEGTNLVETLAAYFRHGCRAGPAAEDLCVHRHTLVYRLNRAREIGGRDPKSGAHILEYTLALKLYDRQRVAEHVPFAVEVR